MKKVLYTLNLNPEQYKPITDYTYPLLKTYAKKIGADFHVISERKFPQWKSPTYEKCQVYELGKYNDWSIFFDADALVHPDTPDITELISKDTVLHNGMDFAPIRWRYDRFFRRDGRNIGSPTWLCVASDWCIELFKPCTDMSPEEAYSNILPIVGETQLGVEPWRLIEDYLFSRNIAKYGLKFKTFVQLMEEKKFGGDYFWHNYAIPVDEKVRQMKDVLTGWRML